MFFGRPGYQYNSDRIEEERSFSRHLGAMVLDCDLAEGSDTEVYLVNIRKKSYRTLLCDRIIMGRH